MRDRVEDILIAAQDDQLVDQLVRFGGFDALLVLRGPQRGVVGCVIHELRGAPPLSQPPTKSRRRDERSANEGPSWPWRRP
jgi:hypothetical protein